MEVVKYSLALRPNLLSTAGHRENFPSCSTSIMRAKNRITEPWNTYNGETQRRASQILRSWTWKIELQSHGIRTRTLLWPTSKSTNSEFLLIGNFQIEISQFRYTSFPLVRCRAFISYCLLSSLRPLCRILFLNELLPPVLKVKWQERSDWKI